MEGAHVITETYDWLYDIFEYSLNAFAPAQSNDKFV